MKNFLVLPLLGAVALLTGCAVEPAYVEAGPTRVYAPGPYYGPGPGPGYYAPEPVYGGTTVVAVEHDRYVDRDHYHHDGRDHYRTSHYSRPQNTVHGHGPVGPRFQNKRGGGSPQQQSAKPATRKKGGKQPDQH